MNGLGLLLQVKCVILRNAFRKRLKRSPLEFATLLLFFIAVIAGLFFLFRYCFLFFQRQEPFGPILVDEMFYLLAFALFVMIFISAAVSAYTSLYRSGEIPFLITRPLDWPDIYFTKFIECVWYSSWGFALITIPFMAAYGIAKGAGFGTFPLLCLAFFTPFVVLANLLGLTATVLTVKLLPSKRRRLFALFIALILVTFFFSHTQSSILENKGALEGVLTGYLPNVAFAKSPLLPSYWTARGILALSAVKTGEFLNSGDGIFYFLVLLSSSLFFFIPSYSVAATTYPDTYLGSQDHAGGRNLRTVSRRGIFESLIDGLAWPPKPALAFLEKDLKTFVRDPAEWSQMIIFFGILLFYFANLKNLGFDVLQAFWKDLIFVLNTLGTCIVLSSFSMRFVFPMLSLESSRFWIINLSPIRLSSLLLEKFFLGTFLSGLITLPLIFLSGWMLDIPLARILYTTGLGGFVCVALTGLSVGLGAAFPNFQSTNPSEIISGFGGTVLLITHLAYLAAIGAFLALARDPGWLGLGAMAAASLLVGSLSMKFGLTALGKMEF